MNDKQQYYYEMVAILLEADIVKRGIVSKVLRMLGKGEPIKGIGRMDLNEVHFWLVSVQHFELDDLRSTELSAFINDVRTRLSKVLWPEGEDKGNPFNGTTRPPSVN